MFVRRNAPRWVRMLEEHGFQEEFQAQSAHCRRAAQLAQWRSHGRIDRPVAIDPGCPGRSEFLAPIATSTWRRTNTRCPVCLRGASEAKRLHGNVDSEPLAGGIDIEESFFDPLPDAELANWER